MTSVRRVTGALLTALTLALWTGCEQDGANRTPVGVDVSGDWSGRYYVQGSGSETPLLASISQNGEMLFIETTLPAAGHLLTGYLGSSGQVLFLTDAFDGETWTAGARATPGRVMLIDYVSGPGTPLQVIDLTR